MSCSLFEMGHNDDHQSGDLTDVIRASSAVHGGFSPVFCSDHSSGDRRLWPHLPDDDSSMTFGDPFLLPQFPAFNFASNSGDDDGNGGLMGATAVAVERPCNIFLRMLQISRSSNVGDGVISTPPCELRAATGNSLSSTPTNASTCSSGSSPAMVNSGLVISSSRNLASRRRKNQVKKVVFMPAPANGRSSNGEVVPSDLWAWRKYGRKPIKGSPYPRGYYRCSSSKGCSARKQVERSHTNPNMLVITYTSDHNHPWPKQRNVLAGSTRSHPSRTYNATIASKTSPKYECNDKNLANAVVKEEGMDDQDRTIERKATTSITTITTTSNHQEERGDHHDHEFSYDLIFADFANQMNDHNHLHHHYPHLADSMNNDIVLFSNHDITKGNDEEYNKDPFLELYDWGDKS